MHKQTTGAWISRLGAATVIAACSESKEETEKAEAVIKKIIDGHAGVPPKKVAIRSMERSVVGGGLLRFGPDEIPVWGAN
jgi:hypothetical protein